MDTGIKDLHRFSSYIQPINLTFHQYLLLTEEPLLVHTGNAKQAISLLPKLQEELGSRNLKYIFVSHFESDECGGVAAILGLYPAAKVICSEVTARQLSGFDILSDCVTKKPGDKLVTDSYELEFFGYPSEMHLWEGLLLMENQRKVFFSADLMLRFGNATDAPIQSDWQTEINSIRPEQIPDPDRRLELQRTLASLSPRYVATGHGPNLLLG